MLSTFTRLYMNRNAPRLALAALLLFSVALPVASVAQNAGSAARLAQLVDYVGVDYAMAVADGEVISEFEYGEMQEFTGLIIDEASALVDRATRERLAPLAAKLRAAVDTRASPGVVAEITDRMTQVLLRSPALTSAPAGAPTPDTVTRIYAQQCAGCHGVSGRGDGPAVTVDMEPAPTDFTDLERARARSLYGLYNTITLGVEGTAMPPFDQLAADQRWALAFLVGAMHIDAETLASGQQAFKATPPAGLPRLGDLTTATLNAVQAEQGQRAATLHAWLRAHPQALSAAQPTPLAIALAGVRSSLDLYTRGETRAAHDAAIDAYLEGFELAEAALSTTQPALVRAVEEAMIGLRVAIREGQPEHRVRASGEQLLTLLQQARDSQTGMSLSPRVAFVSALVIILREGLEAILVLGAMAAFLNKTGRRHALAWLHGGWLAALAAGVLTWVVSNYFITISGATREVTEGVTALLAAAVLFYVGFWMHRRMNARRWQKFLQQGMQRALDGRGLWALAGIAFVAVYREVFETVLFFQALWAQAALPAAQSSTLAGAGAGAVLIVGLAWAIFRFGIRLPFKPFFMATAAIMVTLAVIFAGKGVAALQEAGKLPLDPVHFPRIDLLGIYPTLQSLGLQLIILGAALALVLYSARPAQPAVGQD